MQLVDSETGTDYHRTRSGRFQRLTEISLADRSRSSIVDHIPNYGPISFQLSD